MSALSHFSSNLLTSLSSTWTNALDLEKKAQNKTFLIGIDIYKLLYIKQITNKDLFCSTGNSTQYSAVAYMVKESKKECIYVYVQLIHFV